MALTLAQLQEMTDLVGSLLDQHIAPIFKPGVQLTFIARTPGNDEADVLVTTERDLNEIVAVVQRSRGRPAVRSDGAAAGEFGDLNALDRAAEATRAADAGVQAPLPCCPPGEPHAFDCPNGVETCDRANKG